MSLLAPSCLYSPPSALSLFPFVLQDESAVRGSRRSKVGNVETTTKIHNGRRGGAKEKAEKATDADQRMRQRRPDIYSLTRLGSSACALSCLAASKRVRQTREKHKTTSNAQLFGLTTRNRRQNRPPIKKHIQPDCDSLSLCRASCVFSLDVSTIKNSPANQPRPALEITNSSRCPTPPIIPNCLLTWRCPAITLKR